MTRPRKGHGTADNPTGRFERLAYDRDQDFVQYDPDPDEEAPHPATEYFRDHTRGIIAHNQSPDVGFDASINVYRGCSHACSYCFARPTHEYLGLSAGLDFETKIFVKENAPELLREELSKPSWKPTPLGMSGVTDPYQPIERKLGLTRKCLDVMLEYRQPVLVITKNHLVTRDVDLLAELAKHHAAAVYLSITTLDAKLARHMEPRTSSPQKRLEAIETMSRAGVPAGVLIAPVIPAITDHEMPRIVEAAANAGARSAGYVLLRLPFGLKELFEGWLDAFEPEKKEKVLSRMRALSGGKLYDSQWGTRQRGSGPYAEQVAQMFRVACARHHLNQERFEVSGAAFQRPPRAGDQGDLFARG
jgi:DNA repair photolyase